MKGRNTILVLAVFLVAGIGCGRRTAHVSLPNLVIPVACASEITLLRCDASKEPPRCESVRVKYRSGCEQMVVGSTKIRDNETLQRGEQKTGGERWQ
jgi:hypothetical protein